MKQATRPMHDRSMRDIEHEYWHGHMPYSPAKAGQSGEDRLVSLVMGYRPTKAQRRRYAGAIGRVQ